MEKIKITDLKLNVYRVKGTTENGKEYDFISYECNIPNTQTNVNMVVSTKNTEYNKIKLYQFLGTQANNK